jgi:uncharacterized repeat protein (TIGR01451 family)
MLRVFDILAVRFLVIAVIFVLDSACCSAAPCSSLPAAAFAQSPVYNAADPTEIDPGWLNLVQLDQQYIAKYRGGWVVTGDSLSNNYGNWLDYPEFSLSHLVNLGVSGDKIENAMWRWSQYDFSAWQPTVVVILVGTNNLPSGESPANIVDQMEALTCVINAELPSAQILMFSILPRGARFSYLPQEITAINAALQQDANAKLVPFTYIDANTWIHTQCDPQFAANPKLLLCSLYRDETHVQEWVYDDFTPMVQAALTIPNAGLSVAVAPAANPVKHHGTETWTVTVSNAGPSTATSLEIAQSFSKGSTFLSASSSLGTCQTPAVGGWGTVACSGFDLPIGETVTATLTVSITAADGLTQTDTATAISAVPDVTPANRVATGTVTVAH